MSASSAIEAPGRALAYAAHAAARAAARMFAIDLRALGAFRIGIGLVVLVDVCLRFPYLAAHLSDGGVFPRALAQGWHGAATHSLYFVNGSAWFAGLLLAATAAAAALLAVGLRTRLMTAVVWLLVLSLQHRSGVFLSGADVLLRALLFWSIFLPLGARMSVDSALRETPDPDPARSGLRGATVLSVATFAICAQALSVYWAGALLKTGAEWTQEHTAVYYALSAGQFATAAGQWLLDSHSWALPHLTRFVYLIELYGPIALVTSVAFAWLRLPVAALLMLMHIGFAVFMDIGLFPWVSLCSVILFLPVPLWDWLARSAPLRRGDSVAIRYDGECGFCLRVSRILAVVLALPGVSVQPIQGHPESRRLFERHNSWVVVTHRGESLLAWSALAYLFRRSPLWFWLGALMALLGRLTPLADRAYYGIARRRGALGALAARLLPWQQAPRRLGPTGSLAVLACVALAGYINIQSVSGGRLPELSGIPASAAAALGLGQRWDMFAPRPVDRTRWPVAEGRTRDGRDVDIRRQAFGAADTSRPADIPGLHPYERQRKFHDRALFSGSSRGRRAWAAYECRRWNSKQLSPGSRLRSVSLRAGEARTLLDGERGRATIRDIGEYDCR